MVVGLAMNKNGIYGKWLEIRNQYKRQADLIPMLINMTYNYLSYEHQTFLDVVNARAQALSDALSSTDDVQAIDEVGNDVNTLTTQLKAIVSVEAYPELKGNTVVLETMAEIAGTQNRITVARRRYNDAIVSYNNLLVLTPLGRVFGYSELRGLEFLEVPETPPSIPEWEF